MANIEREVRNSVLASISTIFTAQEDEWKATYQQLLLHRLQFGQSKATLKLDGNTSCFIRDSFPTIVEEVETRVKTVIEDVEIAASDAFTKARGNSIVQAIKSATEDAHEEATRAYNVTYAAAKIAANSRNDIAIEQVHQEFEQYRQVRITEAWAEHEFDMAAELTAFCACLREDSGAMDNVLLSEITDWVGKKGLHLTEKDGNAPPPKRPATEAGTKRGRDGEARSRSHSSSISSFGPASPHTPPGRPLSELTDEALQTTPTAARIRREAPHINVDCNLVQDLQTHADTLHHQKDSAGQTVSSSIHNPANRMDDTPIALDTGAAESVMSPHPPSPAAPPTDPIMTQILGFMKTISDGMSALSDRVSTLERPSAKLPPPSKAPPLTMPPPPIPHIDLKGKGKAQAHQPPAPKVLAPATPPLAKMEPMKPMELPDLLLDEYPSLEGAPPPTAPP